MRTLVPRTWVAKCSARCSKETDPCHVSVRNQFRFRQGVTVNLSGQNLSVKGPKGELKMVLVEHVLAKLEDGGIKVDPKDQSKLSRSCWGMSRTLVSNMVKGVTDGYSKTLEITGVGLSRRGAGQGSSAEPRLQPRCELPDPGRHRNQDHEADRDHRVRHRQAARRPGCRGDPRIP